MTAPPSPPTRKAAPGRTAPSRFPLNPSNTENSRDALEPQAPTLADALDYAARGYQVFPLKPRSKEPATRRGLYEATGNAATLRRYFTGAHPYNLGIRTGVPSGVFVLDVDGEQGFASLAELVDRHGLLPATSVSTTGKGRHYWFRADGPIPC